MSKRTRIWLIVIFVFLLCTSWFTYKQWNNISAFIDSLRYSQEDVIKKLEENKDSVQKILDETENVTVRDLTEEEAIALNSGNLTEEEAISILTGQNSNSASTQDASSGNEKTENNKPENTTPVDEGKNATNQVIAESIAKLYIQKSNYLNKLDNIEAHVRQLYINMSKEERKGAKQRLLTEYLPQVAAWEAECDAIVYGILDEIKTVAKANNQDYSFVSKIEEAYLSEKKLKKSYFINRYMD